MALVIRGLRRLTPRQLLTGASDLERIGAGRGAGMAAIACLAAAVVLLIVAGTGRIPAAAGFFGAGGLVLAGGMAAFRRWLGRERPFVGGQGRAALWRLGTANASWRPNRSRSSVPVCIPNPAVSRR